MRRDAQVVQDPMEYGRIRLKCPDAFRDVCRFEVLRDPQTLEFVAALKVRHSHLLESELSEVTEQFRGARPSAEQFYRGPQPALFQGQPSREIVIGRPPCNSARPGTLRTAIQRANPIEITDRAHAVPPKGCQQGIGDQSRPEPPDRIERTVDIPADGRNLVQIDAGQSRRGLHYCYCTAMKLTLPLSADFDSSSIDAPERTGAVDWTGFNANFDRLVGQRWQDVNQGVRCSLPRRVLRLVLAFMQQKRDAISDLSGKARILSALDIPRDPDIVYFGAEAGWEAALIQALFGNGGRVVLIDQDPRAYQRFLDAPTSARVPAPKGWKEPWLAVERDPGRVEYLREDFFGCETETKFDVGIDWGLIEHFDDDGKLALVRRIRQFLRPGGLQICSCPRDRPTVRLFYRAFADELNFGYRELMTLKELVAHLERAGCQIERKFRLAAHNVVAYRSL